MKPDTQFQDENTGELVSRVKIPDNLLKSLDEPINVNAQSANNFLSLSRQIVALQRKQFEEFDIATNSEKTIGIEVLKMREKMGLDSSWIYNIPLRMMEKREAPPDAMQMPAS